MQKCNSEFFQKRFRKRDAFEMTPKFLISNINTNKLIIKKTFVKYIMTNLVHLNTILYI